MAREEKSNVINRDMNKDEKLKALDAALTQIEKAYGKGSVMKLGDSRANMNIETVPTGSISLDIALGLGGVPKGRIVEVPEIIDRAKKVHDFLTVGAAAPLQEAIIPGLNFGQDYYDALQAEYTHKKDLFLKGLDDLKIVHNDPEGAYYVMLDISEFGYESDLQFCEDLASKVGVGAVPGSSFFREPVNHLIRLHFAKKDETLTDALNRLESLREKIPAKG